MGNTSHLHITRLETGHYEIDSNMSIEEVVVAIHLMQTSVFTQTTALWDSIVKAPPQEVEPVEE